MFGGYITDFLGIILVSGVASPRNQAYITTGNFQEIQLILWNHKNDENLKMAITWPFLIEMAPDFAFQLSLSKLRNFCFLTQKIWGQTKPLAAILYFGKNPFFSTLETPGLVVEYFSGTKMVPKVTLYSFRKSQEKLES